MFKRIGLRGNWVCGLVPAKSGALIFESGELPEISE